MVVTYVGVDIIQNFVKVFYVMSKVLIDELPYMQTGLIRTVKVHVIILDVQFLDFW